MPPNDEPPRKRAKRFHSALMTLVEEGGTPYTSTMTPDMLDARERVTLNNINQIFNPSPQLPPTGPDLVATHTARRSMTPSSQPNIQITQQHNSNDDGDEGNSMRSVDSETPEGGQKRGRGRPRKDHSRPEASQAWSGVRDLEAIHLGQCLEQLLRDNPFRQAGPFLAQCTLIYPTPTGQTGTHTQVLAQLCLTLHNVSTVSCIDHVRWLFQALVAGDMIFARYGNLENSRMIGKIRNEVRGAAVQSATSADGKAIDKMFTMARNVRFICEHFRTGSLFWLNSRFDTKFLNIDVSNDSRIIEETKANFMDRNFDEKIEQSGANQLGDAIRSHLQSSYNVKLDDCGRGDVMVVDNSTSDGLNERNDCSVQGESNGSNL